MSAITLGYSDSTDVTRISSPASETDLSRSRDWIVSLIPVKLMTQSRSSPCRLPDLSTCGSRTIVRNISGGGECKFSPRKSREFSNQRESYRAALSFVDPKENGLHKCWINNDVALSFMKTIDRNFGLPKLNLLF